MSCHLCFFTEQKEKLTDVEQQLKKAEAAQKRRMQNEKAARESEVFPCPFSCLLYVCSSKSYDDEVSITVLNFQAEAIRKILGQDSNRKKREDKIKKRQEELAQVTCLLICRLFFMAML